MLATPVTMSIPGPDTVSEETNDPVEPPEPETPKPPLTMSFTTAPPSEHNGSDEFTFTFEFSEDLDDEFSYATMRDDVLDITQGGTSLTPKAKRVNNGKNGSTKNNQAWNITVTPQGNAPIFITIPPTLDCTAADAVCTDDGRGLSVGRAVYVQGPPGISVADATADENTDSTVDFTVTMDRAAAAQVTIAYATSDGTATAGSDYTSISGTLTFAPGDTSKTVSVTILQGSDDEDSETLTLTLSNASGNNAYLADASATGTIG